MVLLCAISLWRSVYQIFECLFAYGFQISAFSNFMIINDIKCTIQCIISKHVTPTVIWPVGWYGAPTDIK